MGDLGKHGVAVVVEDYKIIADALGRILTAMECFEAVHFFYKADDLVAKIMELSPRFILMDINLSSSQNGLEITKELIALNPALKIIIFSMHNEPVTVKRAFAYGASGYVTKNSPTKEIRVAIECVLNDEIYYCEEIKHLKSSGTA